MSSLTPISVADAKTFIDHWDHLRVDSPAVNNIFQSGYYFMIDVVDLPPSLTGTSGNIHGYLALDTLINPGHNNLKMILISEAEDLALWNDPNYPAQVFVVPYMYGVTMGETNPTWQTYYERMERWNNGYPAWVNSVNIASTEKLTRAFIIPMTDIQRSSEPVTTKYAYFSLKDEGAVEERVDLLFYETNGSFIGLMPDDFTTPVPPFPNGKTGWGLIK